MVQNRGICIRCKMSPTKLREILKELYCEQCIFQMAELYLKDEGKSQELIIKAQKIIMESEEKKDGF